ncbi:MAG: beta-galactosidase [Flavobacteriaceae bacterium]|nr:MAG: beta-galactosidase [Flavobacteriaceae bacterium]
MFSKLAKKISWMLLLIFIASCKEEQSNEIDLSGEWLFQLDSLDSGIKNKWFKKTLTDRLQLPGTVTTNGKGRKVDEHTKWVGDVILDNKNDWTKNPNYQPYLKGDKYLFPFWLIPELHYYGAAWFQKEILVPEHWNDKHLELVLERCHWETKVWINDVEIGSNNSLGTAHRYYLSGVLKPGKNKITICVDNRVKNIDVGPNSHSISDHTQGNWNGIIGEMKLIKTDRVFVKNIQVYPDIADKKIKVVLSISNTTNFEQKAKISLQTVQNKSKNSGVLFTKNLTLKKGTEVIELEYDMGENIALWDEFTPNLYTLKSTLKTDVTNNQKETVFGMREFIVKNKQLVVNDRPVFLRGTLESAIFPKTGFPPTNVEAWKRILNICRAHGLNHIRFHSWCPPKAAFIAADELGFYLQVEVSSWANQGASVGDGKPLDSWLYKESNRMIKAYGNHPSFCMMSYGNEPAGKFHEKFLTEFVNYWRVKDQRRLYTSGAGWPMIDENDFHLSHHKVRIQGWGEGLNSIINSKAPSSDYNFYEAVKNLKAPMVSHEIGQWCAYPNFKELEKYKNSHLKATNFEIFERSLKDHGMEHLSEDFLLASGKLQALCYKADIEAALRTPGFGGFQLLGLHDFPGQGSALVGVLDPFWEQKGYISPEEYRRFCNETVPLVKFPKRIYISDEPINVGVDVSHFGEYQLKKARPKWKITNTKGGILQKGVFKAMDINWGNAIALGEIITSIHTEIPVQLNLEVEVNGFKNGWDFWVYPAVTKEKEDGILIVQKLTPETIKILEEGGNVLLTIKKGSVSSEFGGDIGVGFSSIFWNTAWTGGQKPHTLGILCNPEHPALAEFPTEYHSNWQWWDAMSHSNAINLERFSQKVIPIVRVIDDWVTNRSLSLLFEAKIGKGKLLFSGVDLIENNENRPEARQLLHSLLQYMKSDKFSPKTTLGKNEITKVFK